MRRKRGEICGDPRAVEKVKVNHKKKFLWGRQTLKCVFVCQKRPNKKGSREREKKETLKRGVARNQRSRGGVVPGTGTEFISFRS